MKMDLQLPLLKPRIPLYYTLDQPKKKIINFFHHEIIIFFQHIVPKTQFTTYFPILRSFQHIIKHSLIFVTGQDYWLSYSSYSFTQLITYPIQKPPRKSLSFAVLCQTSIVIRFHPPQAQSIGNLKLSYVPDISQDQIKHLHESSISLNSFLRMQNS